MLSETKKTKKKKKEAKLLIMKLLYKIKLKVGLKNYGPLKKRLVAMQANISEAHATYAEFGLYCYYYVFIFQWEEKLIKLQF